MRQKNGGQKNRKQNPWSFCDSFFCPLFFCRIDLFLLFNNAIPSVMQSTRFLTPLYSDCRDFSEDAGQFSGEMRVTAESPRVWSAAAASLE